MLLVFFGAINSIHLQLKEYILYIEENLCGLLSLIAIRLQPMFDKLTISMTGDC